MDAHPHNHDEGEEAKLSFRPLLSSSSLVKLPAESLPADLEEPVENLLFAQTWSQAPTSSASGKGTENETVFLLVIGSIDLKCMCGLYVSFTHDSSVIFRLSVCVW